MGALQDTGHLWHVCILWLHLCGVVVWLGGLLYSLLVSAPDMERLLPGAQRLRLTLRLEARFRTVMWPALGMVLFTGLVNVMNIFSRTVLVGENLSPVFMQVLGVKLSVVFGMLIIHAVRQFVVQSRRVAWLGRLDAVEQEFPPGLLQLQRLAWVLQLGECCLGGVVLLIALYLRSL